jgi:DNA-binding NarL/FixJ family response regulator
MTPTKIKLLLVDDNKRLTAAWQRLVAQQPDIELVGTLDCADELVAVVRERQADVVLIDLTMDGRDPLEAITDLAQACPDAHTLIYSAHSRSDWYDRAVRAGAEDFLDKADDPAAILDAIRRAGARNADGAR